MFTELYYVEGFCSCCCVRSTGRRNATHSPPSIFLLAAYAAYAAHTLQEPKGTAEDVSY